MKDCRSKIATKEEEDLKAFFAPAEGDAAGTALVGLVNTAKDISIAAHRFSFGKLLSALQARLSGRSAPRVRILADDDMYYAANDLAAPTSPNLSQEFRNVSRLTALGAEARWMETNIREFLLHHNKFLIFDSNAVFAGAGNLTTAGFTENFENYYVIKIPSVIQSFRTQYGRLWDQMATPTGKLPAKYTDPK